jgi:protease-4
LVLELDLTADPSEGVPSDPVSAALARWRPSLRGILDGLRHARDDDRVAGVVARIAYCRMPLARAQEIRNAVAAFRGSGRFTIAFAETFGEFGGGTVPYYLACAFEEVWLAPPGDLGLTGWRSRRRSCGTLSTASASKWDVGARYEYKNALKRFVERDFTHRLTWRRRNGFVLSPAPTSSSYRALRRAETAVEARRPRTHILRFRPVCRSSDGPRHRSRRWILGYRDEVYEAAEGPSRRVRSAAPLIYLDAAYRENS